jgi:TolA-binding protein
VTTIDLHPEEMLDAARRGTLGPQGEADLRAHLDRCLACRLSLSLNDDLRAEASVASRKAGAADAALLARMVTGALVDVPRAAGEPRFGAPRTGMTFRRAAVAAVLLLVGGSAGAGVWANRDAIARRFSPEIVQLAPPASRPPPARAKPAAAPKSQPIEPKAEEAPAPVEAAPVRVRARVAARPAPEASAEALFSEANRARRAGDYEGALRGYAELRRTHPGSREEITARVVGANVLLTQGAAREALAGFDGYLSASSDGTLAEEARVGRALALQRLGRRADERAAWNDLLRKHPDTVQGERARGRLAELR